jgi:hypothetical protein
VAATIGLERSRREGSEPVRAAGSRSVSTETISAGTRLTFVIASVESRRILSSVVDEP